MGDGILRYRYYNRPYLELSVSLERSGLQKKSLVSAIDALLVPQKVALIFSREGEMFRGTFQSDIFGISKSLCNVNAENATSFVSGDNRDCILKIFESMSSGWISSIQLTSRSLRLKGLDHENTVSIDYNLAVIFASRGRLYPSKKIDHAKKKLQERDGAALILLEYSHQTMSKLRPLAALSFFRLPGKQT